MTGSARTVQVTLGIRQAGAAIVAVALAIVLAVALAVGPLAATKPEAVPAAAVPAATAPASAAPPIVAPQSHPGTGGRNQRRLPQ